METMPVNKLTHGVDGEEAIIAVARAGRGGVDLSKIDSALLDMPPIPCGTKEYRGLPLYEKPVFSMGEELDSRCYFTPGNEKHTTGEHARYVDGKLIIHDELVFPENCDSNWEMRVIDNKFPIADERNMITGEYYDRNFYLEKDDYAEWHAVGTDHMLIPTCYHCIRPGLLPYRTMFMIMGELIRRELEKDHVQYVTVFRNNSGFPVRFVVPREIAPEQIIYYIFEGEKSGASQIHPHERIVSIREVPEKIEHSYQKVEEKMRNDRNGHYLYQKLIESGELTLKEGVDAALIVDPVPSHVGGLVVISRSAGSLLEMSDRQRDEFADLVQLGQTLADVYSGGQPSNSYLRQIFEKGEYREKYPHYRLHARIEPRVNIHAGFERAFGIPVITTETGAIKENLSEIIRVYNL